MIAKKDVHVAFGKEYEPDLSTSVIESQASRSYATQFDATEEDRLCLLWKQISPPDAERYTLKEFAASAPWHGEPNSDHFRLEQAIPFDSTNAASLLPGERRPSLI
jgi:hypothetical protein